MAMDNTNAQIGVWSGVVFTNNTVERSSTIMRFLEEILTCCAEVYPEEG